LKNFLNTTARRLLGFNVTVPHKEKILSYLDYVVPKARAIGAVNTVVLRGSRWIGFNTDGDGYLLSLKQDINFKPEGKNILILGAGGAAKAIAVSLASASAKKISLANRTPLRARQLARQLYRRFKRVKFSSGELQGKTFLQSLRHCDLLINTTTVGLKSTSFQDFPWERLKKNAVVSDIVYRPRLTPFLKAAKSYGHRIHTGEGMLVHQGALALELWTGKKPDTQLMRKVILKKLIRN
jgi:shikimate dehydrogenase